ncbi:MAG: hypothetical protein AAGB31_15805 [Bdellovibrio sp.]
MLLKFSTTMLVTFASTLAFAAGAKSTLPLLAGAYSLESGEKRLCQDFTISETALQGNTLALSDAYRFYKTNSTHRIQSEFNANCEFKEENLREERGENIILTRINEELCKGHVVAHTTAELTVRRDSLELRFEMRGAEPYTCIWRKK